jgi:hypothetical protein
MVLFEPYLNHALDDQVKSRIVRLGQTHNVVIYHLLFPCMDTELWNLKQQKLAKASFFVEDEKSSLEAVYACNQTRIAQLRLKVSTLNKETPVDPSLEALEEEEKQGLKGRKGKRKAPSTTKTSEKRKQQKLTRLPKTVLEPRTNVPRALDALKAPKAPTCDLQRNILELKRKEQQVKVKVKLQEKVKVQKFPKIPKIPKIPKTPKKSKQIPQSNLWFCQNENCSARINQKPMVVCGACNTAKSVCIPLVVRKLKRKL